MAGEYRTEEVLKQLPAELAGMIRTGGLRIALAGQPMVGVVRRPDLKNRLAAAYGAIPAWKSTSRACRTAAWCRWSR